MEKLESCLFSGRLFAVLLAAASIALAGCTPAVYLSLFNATGREITVATDSFNNPMMIPPNSSGQFPFIIARGQQLERLFVRTSKESYFYYFRAFHVPPTFWQHGTLGPMCVYTQIDRGGQIYLLAPAQGTGTPQLTVQPKGFPAKPTTKI